VTLQGVAEYRAVLDLLRAGVNGVVAEESFTTTGGRTLPAGSVLFPESARAQLAAAGKAAGVMFEPLAAKPASTELAEAPKVALLVNSANPSRSDTSESLRAIFGDDVGFVSVSTGDGSLATAPEDPLLGYDVIYNAGQGWPANATAQQRLRAFFERGGGYLATSMSTSNFSFLSGAGLVQGSLTLGSQAADGGIAIWENASGAASPVTGVYPQSDFLYLPESVTYFTATPTGSSVDGRYHANMSGTGLNGPSPGFVAGLWRTRMAAANGAPVIVTGETNVDSRYLGFATNPFSRQDAEREWVLIAQAALWSNLTDDVAIEQGSATAASVDSEIDTFYPGVLFTQDIPLLPGERP
jgi:hypothetical protein